MGERLRPGSWLPLPALRSAQPSTFTPRRPPTTANRRTFEACGAEDTQQQQALTQAPSTKQSKSKPVAARRQAAWLGLAASVFWLLTSGFCFCFYLAGRRQNF
jgi:hypothetical protein